MEEPILFYIYGKIDESRKREAIAYLDKSGLYGKPIEFRKTINKAVRENRFTILAKSLGYRDAVSFVESCKFA